jgi:uncharacterized glyoxalase superfamily protein PhnB
MAVHSPVYPAVRYHDTAAALEWLQRAFGLEAMTVSRGDDGAVKHAELRVGSGVVFVGPHNGPGWLGGLAPEPLASPVSIYVVVDDPDGHHARARAAGASIVRDLIDEDYGSREYSARDLEGNLWSFGTYDPLVAR